MTNNECLAKLKKDPDQCPFCGSDNLNTDSLDAYGPSATGYGEAFCNEVECNDCGAAWTGQFRLVGVQIACNPASLGKPCEKCGGKVSADLMDGDTCPHCGHVFPCDDEEGDDE